MASHHAVMRSAGEANQKLMSVLAQAKPAIIGAPDQFQDDIDRKQQLKTSEIIFTNLKLSNESIPNAYASQPKKAPSQQNGLSSQISYKSSLIEDETVLMRQNATNQMRQAASFLVSEQYRSQQQQKSQNQQQQQQNKVRLSATERLALTAKRPQSGENTQNTTNAQQQQLSQMPTLETLLAVQRQLEQHTRQNLQQSTIKPPVNYQCEIPPLHTRLNEVSKTIEPPQVSPLQFKGCHRSTSKPLPPSPPRSPEDDNISGIHYDKDLPPLPQNVGSSCDISEDSASSSQLNSLDSHQSSPATSLVSLPPPPPPISHYLEYYDESVSSCSSLSAAHLLPPPPPPPLPMHQCSENDQAVKQNPNHGELNNTESRLQPQLSTNRTSSLTQLENRYEPKKIHQQAPSLNSIMKNLNLSSSSIKHTSAQQSSSYDQKISSYRSHIFPEVDHNSTSQLQESAVPKTTKESVPSPIISNHEPQMMMMVPPPPPPPPMLDSESSGFDELDCSNDFRFPTPPPVELLLSDDDSDNMKKKLKEISESDQDDEFHCEIPTPPPPPLQMLDPPKSNSIIANTSRLGSFNGNGTKRSYFCSSTFSTNTTNNNSIDCVDSTLQPPSLFRQPSSQLTVYCNENSLLTTKTVNKRDNSSNGSRSSNTMLSMVVPSSSSPSSSTASDGSDGQSQSSNSSSSTSGFHSSIESPSLVSSSRPTVEHSRSKFDKLNTMIDYANYTKHKLYQQNLRMAQQQPQQPQYMTTKDSVTKLPARPALKQKKSVSFSDKVELVACAEDIQFEEHLPNPLLARVLASAKTTGHRQDSTTS